MHTPAKRLLILGAGGHGKVVADCAREMGGWREIEFFDGSFPGRQACGTWPIVGKDSDIFNCAGAGGGDEVFVALGDCRVRLAWTRRLLAAGLTLARIIHPRAIVSSDAAIGAGSIIVAGAIVNIGASIGDASIINTGATIDHDCELAAGVHICPGANLAGNVRVGEASWIGIGSSVRQGVTIGADVIVGAGAAVISDLGDKVEAVGVPARPIVRSGNR